MFFIPRALTVKFSFLLLLHRVGRSAAREQKGHQWLPEGHLSTCSCWSEGHCLFFLPYFKHASGICICNSLIRASLTSPTSSSESHRASAIICIDGDRRSVAIMKFTLHWIQSHSCCSQINLWLCLFCAFVLFGKLIALSFVINNINGIVVGRWSLQPQLHKKEQLHLKNQA